MRLQRVPLLLRRPLTAACAGATLVVPLVLALPPIAASAASPPPALTIVSTSTWTETGRIQALHLVGEVRNNDAQLTAASILLDCRLLDSLGNTVAGGESTVSADAGVLLPDEKSPFDAIFLSPPAFASTTCAVTSVATPQQPDHNFTPTITNVAPVEPGTGAQVITGTVVNQNTIDVSNALLILTLYRNSTDVPPRTIGEERLDLNFGGTLAAGSTTPFTLTHYDPPWTGVAYALLVEAPTPAVTLSPTAVALTQVRTRSISGPPITLQNTGTADLDLGAVTLGGAHPGDWSEVDTCQAATLIPLGSCGISVTFTPTDTGDRSATLSIADDATHSPQILVLTGTGTDPQVAPSPSPMPFPSEPVGTTSPAQTLTVGNPGVGDLHVSAVALGGANPGDFAITVDGCSGTTVPASTSCAVTGTFTPTALGARAATITLTDDALTSPQTVSLTGSGVSSAVTFDSSTRQYAFGNQQVGVLSAPKTVTVTNGGSSPLVVSSACLSNPAEFSLPAGQCASGFTLQPAASKQLAVTMTAGATGFRSTTLKLVDNAPDSPQTATLSGTGTFGGQYHALPPTRILDTRLPGPLHGPLGPGLQGAPALTVNVVTLAGGSVPPQATAVVVNATVTNTTGAVSSFLTLYPANVPRPIFGSNLNWVQGRTVANLVEVGLDPQGMVDVFNALGQTDVVLDIAGYVLPEVNPPTPDGFYNPVVPTRLLDTRGIAGRPLGAPIAPVTGGHTIDLQITGVVPIPASGVAAVVLNVTVTNPTAHDSFVTVFPKGGSVPNVSNVNFVAGQTVPNRVVVKVGDLGKVSFFNALGTVDVVADIGGWYTDSTVGGTGSGFNPLPPTRILDTRGVAGQPLGGPIAPVGQTPIVVPIAGVVKDSAGVVIVPPLTSGTPPTAVVINVTVTNPITDAGGSFLTVWPDGVLEPVVSDLNFKAGLTVPNLVVVKLGADGKIRIANAKGTADVVVDVVGWYS